MGSIEAMIDRQLRKWELEKQLQDKAEEKGEPVDYKPIVTVSRQRGSQGSFLAERLSERLGYQLLHREIIDEICLSSGYRRQIIESLDAKVRSKMELWFEGVFNGMCIDASDYFKHLYKVIMSISALGGVIVVGRGSNFMLRQDQGFHIRVVAPVPKRIDNLMKHAGLSRENAIKEIEELDKSRTEFIKTHFRMNIDDARHYDLVINTSYIDINNALEISEKAMQSKIKLLQIDNLPEKAIS